MSDNEVIYFDTENSAALFDGADVKSHFWSLCRYFVSETFMTYCGIASGVTVLNSLGVPSPDAPQIYPYKIFMQENFFTDEVLQIRRPHDVEKNGSTLDQLASMLSVFEVKVDVYHADSLTVDQSRTMLIETLRSPHKRVIIDFNRKDLGQKGSGHFSPLAAYHSGEDRFLLMDVARYKLPPCWVQADLLYKALTDVDSVSQKGRGFLILTCHRTSASVGEIPAL
jgi:hypothetical protein